MAQKSWILSIWQPVTQLHPKEITSLKGKWPCLCALSMAKPFDVRTRNLHGGLRGTYLGQVQWARSKVKVQGHNNKKRDFQALGVGFPCTALYSHCGLWCVRVSYHHGKRTFEQRTVHQVGAVGMWNAQAFLFVSISHLMHNQLHFQSQPTFGVHETGESRQTDGRYQTYSLRTAWSR